MIVWALMYMFSDGVIVQTSEAFLTEVDCKKRVEQLKQNNLTCEKLILK